MSEDVVMSGWSKALLATLATLTAAVIGILTSFGAVHWNTTQTALVAAEAAAFWALMSAVVAHYSPQTKKQPVAVAGTVTAFATATVAVGVGFSWWSVTQQENAYITSLVTALIAVGSALVARTKVYAQPPPPTSPPSVAGEGPTGEDAQADQDQATAQVLQAAQAILDGSGKSAGNSHHKTIKTASDGHAKRAGHGRS